jgi:hypothetical protein
MLSSVGFISANSSWRGSAMECRLQLFGVDRGAPARAKEEMVWGREGERLRDGPFIRIPIEQFLWLCCLNRAGVG